jgi:hypothetical protein
MAYANYMFLQRGFDDFRLSSVEERLQVHSKSFANLAEHSNRTILPENEIQTYQLQLLKPAYTMNTFNITPL